MSRFYVPLWSCRNHQRASRGQTRLEQFAGRKIVAGHPIHIGSKLKRKRHTIFISCKYLHKVTIRHVVEIDNEWQLIVLRKDIFYLVAITTSALTIYHYFIQFYVLFDLIYKLGLL